LLENYALFLNSFTYSLFLSFSSVKLSSIIVKLELSHLLTYKQQIIILVRFCNKNSLILFYQSNDVGILKYFVRVRALISTVDYG